MIRKIVLMIVCLLFVLSVAFPRIRTVASPETRLYVDPPALTVAVDQTFTVNVSIADVEYLDTYGFKLCYNTTILDGLDVTLPPGHFFEQYPRFFIATLEVVDNYNATHGRVWAAVSCEPPGLGASGSGVLVAITFKGTGVGESVLDLYDTVLGDFEGNLIPHDVFDGYVEVKLLGDVNFDRIVDISDVVLAAVAFGSMAEDDPNTPWDETKNWNPYADIYEDGVIDIFDLVIIGVNFGKKG